MSRLEMAETRTLPVHGSYSTVHVHQTTPWCTRRVPQNLGSRFSSMNIHSLSLINHTRSTIDEKQLPRFCGTRLVHQEHIQCTCTVLYEVCTGGVRVSVGMCMSMNMHSQQPVNFHQSPCQRGAAAASLPQLPRARVRQSSKPLCVSQCSPAPSPSWQCAWLIDRSMSLVC